MSWVSEALDNFITGLQDSLSIADAVRHLSGCKIAKWNACYSVLLNGILLLGSFYLLEESVLASRPVDLVTVVLRFLMKKEYINNSTEPMTSGAAFCNQAIWVIIFHQLSVRLNMRLFQKIAAASLDHVNIMAFKKDIKVTIRDNVYRLLLILFTFVEAAVVRKLLPIFGEILSFSLFCWMNAYHSFDTVWTLQGIPLPQQISLLESHWAYFLGFGVPLSATCHFLPYILGLFMWSLLFPAFIILAINGKWAQPSESLKKFGPSKSPRMPIFQFSMWASNYVIKRFLRLLGGRRSCGSDEIHRTRTKHG